LALIVTGGCGGIRPIAELPVNVGRRVLVDLPVGLAKDATNAVVETVTGWKPFKGPVPATQQSRTLPDGNAVTTPPPQAPAASSPEAQDRIALEAARRAEVKFRLTMIGIVGSIAFALMILWTPTRAFAFPVALGFSGMGTVIVAKLVIEDVLWLALACVILLGLYLLGLLLITAIRSKGKDKMIDTLTDGVELSHPETKRAINALAVDRNVEGDLRDLLVKKGYAKAPAKPAAKKKS